MLLSKYFGSPLQIEPAHLTTQSAPPWDPLAPERRSSPSPEIISSKAFGCMYFSLENHKE